jgi:hypothetical protein
MGVSYPWLGAWASGDRKGPGRSLGLCEADEIKQTLEVVIAVVFNLDSALFRRVLDGDVGGEVLAEAVGDGADVNVHLAACGFFGIAGFIG